jgi:hypothetical protein
MPLKTSYDGSGFQAGYAGIEAQLFLDVDRTNGNVRIPDDDGTILPKLTNGQVAALATAWRRAAARSKAPSWPAWYDITIAALGWTQPGDKFIMTREHAAKVAAPELLVLFWAATKELAAQLDATGTKRAPLIVSYAWSGYEQSARDAWQTMQREQKQSDDGSRLEPFDESKIEIDDAKPAESSGWGGAVLLIVLLLAAAKKSKRRR